MLLKHFLDSPHHYYESFFNDFFNQGLSGVPAGPDTHIDKTDEGYKVSIAVPGLLKENLIIEIKDGILDISTKEEKEESYTKHTKAFSKSYKLSGIKEDAISARLENGILEILLPTEQDAIRKIEIA